MTRKKMERHTLGISRQQSMTMRRDMKRNTQSCKIRKKWTGLAERTKDNNREITKLLH